MNIIAELGWLLVAVGIVKAAVAVWNIRKEAKNR